MFDRRPFWGEILILSLTIDRFDINFDLLRLAMGCSSGIFNLVSFDHGLFSVIFQLGKFLV